MPGDRGCLAGHPAAIAGEHWHRRRDCRRVAGIPGEDMVRHTRILDWAAEDTQALGEGAVDILMPDLAVVDIHTLG